MQRQRRKAFYLRNGLKETGMNAMVFETEMELLTHDAELTFAEYVGMYENVFSKEKARNVIKL